MRIIFCYDTLIFEILIKGTWIVPVMLFFPAILASGFSFFEDVLLLGLIFEVSMAAIVVLFVADHFIEISFLAVVADSYSKRLGFSYIFTSVAH